MLKDTQKTRRSLILDGYLAEMPSLEGGIPTAITRSLISRGESLGCQRHEIRQQTVLSWRIHSAVHRNARPAGHQEQFPLFLDCEDGMVPIQAKAIFGRGDFGEPVLTFADVGETVEFSGTVTRIRADYVLYLSNFMGKEGESSFRIEVSPHPESGLLLCATAGSCMGVVHAEGYCEEPFFLQPGKKMLAECKAKYGEAARYVILDGARATVETGQGRVCHIEPLYPVSEHSEFGWTTIVTKALESAAANPVLNAPVNAAELGRFFINVPEGRSAFRFYCAGSEEVIVVKIAGLPEFLGLLAPVRVNGFGGLWPEWLNHLSDEFSVDVFMEQWTKAQGEPEAAIQ
jgi:hypothetical protein